MRVSVASSVYYPTEIVRVSLEANAIYDIDNFLMECVMDGDYLEFDTVESNNQYIVTATQKKWNHICKWLQHYSGKCNRNYH